MRRLTVTVYHQQVQFLLTDTFPGLMSEFLWAGRKRWVSHRTLAQNHINSIAMRLVFAFAVCFPNQEEAWSVCECLGGWGGRGQLPFHIHHSHSTHSSAFPVLQAATAHLIHHLPAITSFHTLSLEYGADTSGQRVCSASNKELKSQKIRHGYHGCQL